MPTYQPSGTAISNTHTHTVYVYLLSPFSFFLPLLPCQHKRPYAVCWWAYGETEPNQSKLPPAPCTPKLCVFVCGGQREREKEAMCVCSTVIVYSVVIFILFASFAFCPLSTRAIIRWWQWIEGTITTRENKKATHVCMEQRANKKPPNISHARVDNHMRVYFFRCSSLLLLLLNVFPLLRFL